MDALLLDTHAPLWWLVEPKRLSTGAHAAIADDTTRVCVSAASGWEIATKVRLGKLPAANELVDNLTLVTREKLVPLPDATPNAVHMGQHLGIQLMHQQ